MSSKLAVVDLKSVQQVTERRLEDHLAHAVALVAWWIAAIVTPIVGVVVGLIYGIIVGAATGVMTGVNEAITDVRRWWEMYEEMR